MESVGGFGCGRADVVGFSGLGAGVQRKGGGEVGFGLADGAHVAADADAKLREQVAADRPRGHPGHGFSRRGAL